MTRDEARERLITLASLVALEAPARRNEYAIEARIPWVIVDEIRETLTAGGFDYHAVRARYERIKAASK